MARILIDWDLEASKALLRPWGEDPSSDLFTSPQEFVGCSRLFSDKQQRGSDEPSKSVRFMRECGLPTHEDARRAMWMALRKALDMPVANLVFDDHDDDNFDP